MKATDYPPLNPKVVLGVAAHPDDLDFSAAGTMAGFAMEGAAVYYLILTDGGKGTHDHSMPQAELIKMRQQEQRTAAKAVGAKDVLFLSYPDGALSVTIELKKDIVKIIRKLKPDVVITMDPSMIYSSERGFINHPDHRAAGQATLDAIFPLARDYLAFPELESEGCTPHEVTTVLLTNFDRNEYCVDISDTIEAKMAALAAHTSQIPDLQAMQEHMKQRASELGQEAGHAYAECFVRIDVKP